METCSVLYNLLQTLLDTLPPHPSTIPNEPALPMLMSVLTGLPMLLALHYFLPLFFLTVQMLAISVYLLHSNAPSS